MGISISLCQLSRIIEEEKVFWSASHARQNTTSVYTAGKIFPMLPEKLSTDLTYLNYHEDRPVIVIEALISFKKIH